MIAFNKSAKHAQCTEGHLASFLSGGFITAIVAIPPERKLAKRTSVQCLTNVNGAQIEQ